MWIRVKDSGQEIDIPDSRARYFIANGDAIEIKPPVVKAPAPVIVPPPARRLSLEPFYGEALKMVHFSGLPINATEIVMRLLALEERFDTMVGVRVQRVLGLEARVTKLLADVKGLEEAAAKNSKEKK